MARALPLLVSYLALVTLGSTPAAHLPLDFVPHPPIVIESNADFESALSGVRGGAGTQANPYIIEGWEIRGVAGGPFSNLGFHGGITIVNTSAHVVIQKNFIHDGAGGGGFFIEGARNVIVRQNLLSNGSIGLVARNADNLRVDGNTFHGLDASVAMAHAGNVHIARNVILCAPFSLAAIELTTVHAAQLLANRIVCPDGPGIRVRDSAGVSVEDNIVEGSGGGVIFESVVGLEASGNRLERNRDISLGFLDVDQFSISNNLVSSAEGTGIKLSVGGNGQVVNLFHNNHIHSAATAFMLKGFPKPYTTLFSNNTIDGKPIVVHNGLSNATLEGRGSPMGFLALIDSTNVRVANWTIETSTDYSLQVVNGSDVLLEGNMLRDAGMRIWYGTHNTVRANHVVNANGSALALASPRAAVLSNLLEGKTGIMVRAENLAGGRGYAHAVGSNITGNDVASVGCGACVRWTDDVTFTLNKFNSLDGSDEPLADITGSRGLRFLRNSFAGGNIERSGWTPEEHGLVNATHNWWGSADGPDPDNANEDGIVYVPWLPTSP